MEKISYWTPRSLGIAFLCFLWISALGIYDDDPSVWAIITLLVMRLFPAYVFTILLFVAWKNEPTGGIIMFFSSFFVFVLNMSVGVKIAVFFAMTIVGFSFISRPYFYNLLSKRYPYRVFSEEGK